MTDHRAPRPTPAATRSPGPGTPTRRSWPASSSGSSAAAGSTPATSASSQGPGSYFASDDRAGADRDHLRPRRRRCAGSSTSAATAARSWPAARSGGAPCNAPTTPGRTTSTAACGPRRAAAQDPAFDAGTARDWCRSRSGPGDRSCSPTPTPTRSRCLRRSPTCRRSSPSTASTSTRCGSTGEFTTRSAPTGRSRSRTTSSATTARSTIRASCEVFDERRLELRRRRAAGQPVRADPPALTRRHAGRSTPAVRSARLRTTCGSRASSSTCCPVTRTCRSGRCGRPARRPARAISTTGSATTPTSSGSSELFEFDSQVGAEDTALVEAAQRGSARGHDRARLGARRRRDADRPFPGLHSRSGSSSSNRARRRRSVRRGLPASELRKIVRVRGEQFIEHRLGLIQIEPCRDRRLEQEGVQRVLAITAERRLDHLLLERT